MLFIISPRNDEISERILNEVERGITELQSRGGYSKKDGTVLLCAVQRQEVHHVYGIIYGTDPDAFVIVGEAGEIRGEGFYHSVDHGKPMPKPARRLSKRNKRFLEKIKRDFVKSIDRIAGMLYNKTC